MGPQTSSTADLRLKVQERGLATLKVEKFENVSSLSSHDEEKSSLGDLKKTEPPKASSEASIDSDDPDFMYQIFYKEKEIRDIHEVQNKNVFDQLLD